MVADILRILNASQDLEPLSVAFQVSLMTVTSLVTITIFNVLRPKFKIIYEPKVKYHLAGKQPPPASKAPLGWIPPLIHTKEPHVITLSGLDAAVFLRFLRMLRWLLTLCSLVCCGLLIPLDMFASRDTLIAILNPSTTNSTSSSTQPNFFTTMTIRHVPPPILYAHIATTYIITFLLVTFLLTNWNTVARLRHNWFCSPEFQKTFYQRTLYISNVPARKRSDRGLLRIMNGFKPPFPITSAYMARQVGDLPQLIKEHNDTVIAFEKVIVAFLSGNKLRVYKRPTLRVGGFCGIGGRKYDAIEYYTHRLKQTEAAVQQYRAQVDMFSPEPFGFASLSDVQSAHEAAKELKGEHLAGNFITGMRMELAPHPQDIIWNNASLSPTATFFRQISGHAILLISCALSILPAVITATLASLDSITQTSLLPSLTSLSHSSPILYTLISGLSPPLISLLFSRLLPPLMYNVSLFMGPKSYSQLDRVVVKRYYAFLVVSQVVLFMAMGVIVNTVISIILHLRERQGLSSVFEDIDELPKSIAASYVDQSSFWLKWFPLRVLLCLVDLAQPGHFSWVWFKTK